MMQQPLAYYLRPLTLEGMVGQERIKTTIKSFLEKGQVPSMIFRWAPWCGKTTLATILSHELQADFFELSGVRSRKEDLNQILEHAQKNQAYGKRTLLFLDEIHRRNKAQQDALLPFVESGLITLIGATTENPSFTINNALLSRAKVLVFEPLRETDIVQFFEMNRPRITSFRSSSPTDSTTPSLWESEATESIQKTGTPPMDSSPRKLATSAQNDSTTPSLWESGANESIQNDSESSLWGSKATESIQKTENQLNDNDEQTNETFTTIASLSNGDLRNACNLLESSMLLAKDGNITPEIIKQAFWKPMYYDRDGEEHYNIISAVHKCLRDSDPHAACYRIQRMLVGGEDPRFIARRLLRFASEDIGPADNNALLLANQVYDAVMKIWMPECRVFLFQLALYLAKAPKNNICEKIDRATMKDVEQYGNLPVPLQIRNAPTKIMKELWYGAGYQYAHDLEHNRQADGTITTNNQHLPDELRNRKYF